MTTTVAMSTIGHALEWELHQRRAKVNRTKMTSLESDWLSAVVADWDAVFDDDSTTATQAVDSAGWITACRLGDRSASIEWSGSEQLVLIGAPGATMTWHVLDLPRGNFASVGHAPSRRPMAQPGDIVHMIEGIADALGVTERDALAASGIRDRTYYNWKSNPGVRPRVGSQALLWGVVDSVTAIVEQLEDAPRWLHADPDRLRLFLTGQHARLALLAAAAAEGVRVPSDTLDRHHTDDHSDAERLKKFRTRHAVQLTHDEDGASIGQATNVVARFYQDELEDELIMTDVDD